MGLSNIMNIFVLLCNLHRNVKIAGFKMSDEATHPTHFIKQLILFMQLL